MFNNKNNQKECNDNYQRIIKFYGVIVKLSFKYFNKCIRFLFGNASI